MIMYIIVYIKKYIKGGCMNSIQLIKATNVTTFRNNLKKQLDQVSTDDVTLIVTRSDDKNVLVMSESEYEALIKSINNLTYDLMLFKSAQEAKTRDFIPVSLD